MQQACIVQTKAVQLFHARTSVIVSWHRPPFHPITRRSYHTRVCFPGEENHYNYSLASPSSQSSILSHTHQLDCITIILSRLYPRPHRFPKLSITMAAPDQSIADKALHEAGLDLSQTHFRQGPRIISSKTIKGRHGLGKVSIFRYTFTVLMP